MVTSYVVASNFSSFFAGRNSDPPQPSPTVRSRRHDSSQRKWVLPQGLPSPHILSCPQVSPALWPSVGASGPGLSGA